MKKCSKSAHHAVTELNITPLLDLAFVLLVIFIITTTPIVNDLDLNLPKSVRNQKDPPRKANYITVDASGQIWLNKAAIAIDDLQPQLVELRLKDNDLNVIVRGDGMAKYRQIRAILDACQQANIAKVDLATEPEN